MFTETKDEKIAELGKVNEILGISSMTPLQTDNLWQTILYSLTTREYEFDNVDDSVFVEPDISQYTLKDKE